MDYCGINEITIANPYLLPIISELLHYECGSKIFTQIDRKSGYYLICIKEGEEWKTTFG
jgi:hypothetical protein